MEPLVSVKEVREQTSQDALLKKVLQLIRQGWTADSSKLAPELRPFFVRGLDITEAGGFLLWGIRLIIPSKPRNRSLQSLYHCHHSGTSSESALGQNVPTSVDDLLFSLDDRTETVGCVKELKQLMETAGFCLTKWSSNEPTVLRSLPEKDVASDCKPKMALGIVWDNKEDTITFPAICVERSDQQMTKRGMMSEVMKNFDPLGYLSPFLVKAKQCEDAWPTAKLELTIDRSPEFQAEVRKSTCELHVQAKTEAVLDVQKYSSLTKLLNVTAYVFCFITNCKVTPEERKTTPLHVREIDQAEQFWLKTLQNEEFPEELVLLKRERNCRKWTLTTLRPPVPHEISTPVVKSTPVSEAVAQMKARPLTFVDPILQMHLTA
ncbi:Alkanesulfonate monooxygenase [Trichinella spiralis]|uniref:Alkanesulfonate monooxygenase n=1 Tax=Trichinella spiralis TaxID=6334 RepID=A0ABR3KA53_TRISP